MLAPAALRRVRGLVDRRTASMLISVLIAVSLGREAAGCSGHRLRPRADAWRSCGEEGGYHLFRSQLSVGAYGSAPVAATTSRRPRPEDLVIPAARPIAPRASFSIQRSISPHSFLGEPRSAGRRSRDYRRRPIVEVANPTPQCLPERNPSPLRHFRQSFLPAEACLNRRSILFTPRSTPTP